MGSDNALLPQLHGFMRKIGVDYALCGGHAIDVYVGRKTRPHKDLDVAVFWDDRDRVVEYMLGSGWMVFEPVGAGYLHNVKNVDSQRKVRDNIWCVRPGNRHYQWEEKEEDMFAVEQDNLEQTELDYIEFLFNHQKDGRFLYTRDSSISRAMEHAVLKSGDIPYLAPEIALLYKSTTCGNPDDQHDFDVALPLLRADSKDWLRGALQTMYSNGHVWLDRIDEKEQSHGNSGTRMV